MRLSDVNCYIMLYDVIFFLLTDGGKNNMLAGRKRRLNVSRKEAEAKNRINLFFLFYLWQLLVLAWKVSVAAFS